MEASALSSPSPGAAPGLQSPVSPVGDPAPPAKKEETTIPPELAAEAAEWTVHRAPDGTPYYHNAIKRESVWEKPKPLKELEQLQARNLPDRRKPKWTTTISGTPWLVVWTGDGRVFFYNPTTHSSVWERPLELMGREDVDRAVSQPPPDYQPEPGDATPPRAFIP